MMKLSLVFMLGLTVVIATGLRWREEKTAADKPGSAPRRGFIAAQKHKFNRYVTAAALAALATILVFGGINWLRIWQGS